MTSNSGKSYIVFNGEIYNHQLIRKELFSNFRWKGNDTKTLVELIERFGIDTALKNIKRMYSFAYLDMVHKDFPY